jgi:hypothetical protein
MGLHYSFLLFAMEPQRLVLLALAFVVRLFLRFGGIALLVLRLLLVTLFWRAALLAGLWVATLTLVALLGVVLTALVRGIVAVLMLRSVVLRIVAVRILLFGLFLGGFT